jgi:hypothetical protein
MRQQRWLLAAVWDESFGGAVPANNAINLGVSGDRIEHVLFRLQPAAAVDSIFAGIKTVVEAVHARKPGTRVLLQSLLPTNDPVKNRELVQPVNARHAALVAVGSAEREIGAVGTGFIDRARE